VLLGAAGTGVTRFAKRGFIERIKRQDFLQILKAVEQKIYEIDSRYHRPAATRWRARRAACSTQYS